MRAWVREGRGFASGGTVWLRCVADLLRAWAQAIVAAKDGALVKKKKKVVASEERVGKTTLIRRAWRAPSAE